MQQVGTSWELNLCGVLSCLCLTVRQGNWKVNGVTVAVGAGRGRAGNLPHTGRFHLLEFLSLGWQLVLRTRKATSGASQNYEN